MKSLFRIFRRRREDELALIDAEITAFGEALAQHALVPEQHTTDPEILADYGRALDAYDHAKRAFLGDRDRADAADVILALDEGRHALACVDARLADHPTPPRRALCFFDPRHGPSADRVTWTPEGGVTRAIDVCAADAVRLTEGMPPIATGHRSPPHPRPSPQSRRSVQARPPAQPRPAAPTPQAHAPQRSPRPFRSCPPGVPKAQRAQGQGSREFELPREPSVPLVLVVRVHGYRQNRVDLIEAEDTRLLLRIQDRGRVVEPLPVREDKHVRLHITSQDPWEAWLQPIDTVPIVDDRISAHGSFVLHYAGGPADIHMTHTARGDFSVTELTPDFEQGRHVLSGKNYSPAQGHLLGPTYLHVRAKRDWTITLTQN
ncbi:hypothetical protein [Actinomadura sp. 6N118]|uniref:hypothetical protein n=1 Tax=Actinomadura sp. 6N118 TaxID=3375151 RepID=UPI0037994C01